MTVDEVFHQGGHGTYELTRMHHPTGTSFGCGSTATATPRRAPPSPRFSPALFTWTIIAGSPGGGWHRTTPTASPDVAPLIPVADEVLQRARQTLPATPPFTTPGR
ncbi:hypothetical protein FHG89_30620 [Micromonospora orduensis]|uniref:Uncharacterized protein n=1 Tax=Micromonospora orduensis TaxID=1420891 RepID=A0A5C4Q8U2_9ACTN|nr:hypothetical protein [Micromonospora orduensis]TNH21811.1 hypothetical protein FHG89_30620 [Micromonospora orduensis]